MNRLIIAAAVALAASAVSVPAVAGLTNNPSFSHKLPVHVPSSAKIVQLDDDGNVVGSTRSSEHPSSTTVTSPTRSGEPEPGDDDGSSTEPGDEPTSGGNHGPGDGSSSDSPGPGGGSSSGGDSGRGGSGSGSDHGGSGG